MDNLASHGGSVFEMFVAQNPWVDIKLAILHAQFKKRSTSPNLRGMSTNHIFQLLQKSFNGLKQAPFHWNKMLDEALIRSSFKPIKADMCTYLKKHYHHCP